MPKFVTSTVATPLSPPEPFAVVLKAAVRRLQPEYHRPWPQWVDGLQTPEPGRKLAAWLRDDHDLQLVEAGNSLEAALGSSAELLLLEMANGWYAVDCREGTAVVISSQGDQMGYVSALDARAVYRILSLRPAQDVTPRAATHAQRSSAQKLVARALAEGGLQLLQPVEPHVPQGQLAPFGEGARQASAQAFHQDPAVRQAGDGVGVRQPVLVGLQH